MLFIVCTGSRYALNIPVVLLTTRGGFWAVRAWEKHRPEPGWLTIYYDFCTMAGAYYTRTRMWYCFLFSTRYYPGSRGQYGTSVIVCWDCTILPFVLRVPAVERYITFLVLPVDRQNIDISSRSLVVVLVFFKWKKYAPGGKSTINDWD